MSNSTNGTCLLSPNTDITGIGVRLSFYLQSFLLVILADRSWQDAPSAIWTFIASSFGLTISAIIQARESDDGSQLTFYQALQVSNLVWLANFGIFISIASYSRHRKSSEKREAEPGRPHGWSSTKMKLAAMCQTLFTMALTIFMWERPGAFGSDEGTIGPSDNSTNCTVPLDNINYVAFFADLPATGSGKAAGLGFSIFLMASYILVSLYDWYFYLSHKRKRRHRPKSLSDEHYEGFAVKDEEEVVPAPYNQCPPNTESIAMVYPASVGVRSVPSHLSLPMVPPDAPSFPPSVDEHAERRPRAENRHPKVDPMFLGVTALSALIFVYFVITIELMIKRNNDRDNGQWAFGQVFALVLVVPVVLQVIQAFKEHGFAPVHRNLKRHVREKRPRENDPFSIPASRQAGHDNFVVGPSADRVTAPLLASQSGIQRAY